MISRMGIRCHFYNLRGQAFTFTKWGVKPLHFQGEVSSLYIYNESAAQKDLSRLHKACNFISFIVGPYKRVLVLMT